MNPPMTFYPLQRVSKGGRPITPEEARAMLTEIRRVFHDTHAATAAVLSARDSIPEGE